MLILNNQESVVEISETNFLNNIKRTLRESSDNLRIRTNIKFVIEGEGAVGKTTLVQRYLGRPFCAQYLVTLGVQTSVVNVNLAPLIGIEKIINLQLWDLAGQPQFKQVLRPFFRGTDIAIIVGDLSRLSTFEPIVNWITETNKHNMKKTPFLLVGSKFDLIESSRVSIKTLIKEQLLRIKDFTRKDFNELLFIETSAKKDLNIIKVFQIALLKNILANNR
ncbi:MAG: Rab family GTPase [Candidatus Thorarchaeota archaeon]